MSHREIGRGGSGWGERWVRVRPEAVRAREASDAAYRLQRSNPLPPRPTSTLPQSPLRGAGLRPALHMFKTRSSAGQVAVLGITAASWRPRLFPATSTPHRPFGTSISRV